MDGVATASKAVLMGLEIRTPVSVANRVMSLDLGTRTLVSIRTTDSTRTWPATCKMVVHRLTKARAFLIVII